jgi:hypothetical protein
VGHRIRLATEAAKSTKKSHAQDSHYFTNISRQENGSPATSQKTEERLTVTYAKATRNSTETPAITTNNTQEHTLIKIMQEFLTRFEKILSRQAEQRARS